MGFILEIDELLPALLSILGSLRTVVSAVESSKKMPILFPESENVRQYQPLGFDQVLMSLRSAYHLIYVHLWEILLYLDLISLLFAHKPESIAHVLVLYSDLEILNLYSLMFLLHLEEVLSQLQVRLQYLLYHIDRKD